MNMRPQNISQNLSGYLANRIKPNPSQMSLPSDMAQGGVLPLDFSATLHLQFNDRSHNQISFLDRQRSSANDPSQPHEHSTMRKIQNVGEVIRARP